MASDVVLPEIVVQEIRAGLPADPSQPDLTRDALANTNLRRVLMDPIPEDIASLALDAGESAVLALARQLGYTAVVDDRKARHVALSLGIPVIGTVGIVLRAKAEGHIPSSANLL